MNGSDDFRADMIGLLAEILLTLQDVRSEVSRLNAEADTSVQPDVSRETSDHRGTFHGLPPITDLPAPTVMVSNGHRFLRQRLPDGQSLLAVIERDGRLTNLRLELATGERIHIAEAEVEAMFGPLPLLPPMPGDLPHYPHPTDRSLNEDYA
jgi:hypothetical protein